MKNYLFFLCLLSFQVSAQQVRMVKDLNPGTDSGFPTFDNQYRIYAGLDSVCIFLASGKGNIRLLCSSDGTDVGTISILPPLDNETEFLYPTVSGKQFWFVLRDANDHDKLYSTDGTWAGTTLRIDEPAARITRVRAFPGGVVYSRNPDNFDPEELVRVQLQGSTVTTSILAKCEWFGGLRDFTVQDSTIWAVGSQETVSDRYLFKCSGVANSRTDIALMNTGSEFNQNLYMTPVGTKCFWFWQRGTEPYSLWVSDGTAAGTKSLKDFETPFFQDLIAERAIIAFQDKLFFQAENLASGAGQELWVSDGTVVGTKLVKDFSPGNSDGLPDQMVIYGNRLYFTALNDLWNTRVYSYATSSSGANEAYTGFAANEYFGAGLTVFRDSLVFGGYRSATGAELWTAGLSTGSARTLSNESPNGSDAFNPYNCTPTLQKLFFIGNKPSTSGYELWVYQPNATVSAWSPVALSTHLRLAPNPAATFTSLTVPDTFIGGCHLAVYDLRGKLIQQTSGLSGGQLWYLDTGTFSPGAYQVVLQDERGKVAAGWLVVE